METIWTCSEDAPKCSSADGNWQVLSTNCWCAMPERTTTDYTTVVLNVDIQNSEHHLQLRSKVDLDHALETASNKQNWVEPIDKESCWSGTSETDLAIVHVFVLSNSLWHKSASHTYITSAYVKTCMGLTGETVGNACTWCRHRSSTLHYTV